MKSIIFASFLFCLAGTAAAQQQTQQTDSTPPPSLWVKAITPSHSGAGPDYLSSDTCWGDASDLGLLLSTDGGMNWYSVPKPVFGLIPVMRNAHEGYMFPTQKTWVYKTTDAWRTWDSVPCPMLVASATIVDSLRAFTADGDEVGRTTDGGRTWIVYPGAIGGSIGFANPAVGYVVGGKNYGPLPGEYGAVCFKTVDSGKTWYQIYTGIPEDAGGIAVLDPYTVVIMGSDWMYRTTDSGAHWQRSEGSNPGAALNGIAMNGARGYVAGDKGLILSTLDSGKTWAIESTGLPNEYLGPVALFDDTLAAVGGSDSGIILIRRSGSASVQAPSSDSLAISAFPNPAQDQVTFQYTLPSAQSVSLAVFDAAGHLMTAVMQSTLQNPGVQSIPMSTANLSSGTYLYQFSSEQYSANGSFTIIK